MTPAQLAVIEAQIAAARSASAALLTQSAAATNIAAALQALVDADAPPPPAPTYALTADPPQVNEGAVLTFRLTTTNVAPGTLLPYVLQGVSAADVGAPMSGQVVVGQDGRAALVVPVLADQTTEGVETITCVISTGNGLARASASAAIGDASVTPPPPGSLIVKVSTNGSTFPPPHGVPIIEDTLDLSRSMPPIPWDLFRDGIQTIAPPMEGRMPDNWVRLSLYGLPNTYAQWTTALVDGRIFTQERDGRHYEGVYPSSVASDDPNALIIPTLRDPKQYPLRGGARGQAIFTGFSLTRGHSRVRRDGTINTDPRVPLWISLDMLGQIWFLMRDGSMAIAGKVPLAERSYANDFSFWDFIDPAGNDMRSIFWVTDTAAGRILRVDRHRIDVADEWCRVPSGRRATSVRAIGRKLYVCDEVDVWEFDALDKSMAPRKVCSLLHVFFVDYTSTGALVVITRNGFVHRVDVATGAIGPNLSKPYFVAGGVRGWAKVEVDRSGSVGPRDTIFAVMDHAVPGNGPHVIFPDGTNWTWNPTDGNGASFVGDARATIEAGHYPWDAAIHPDEGLMLFFGGAQILPAVYAAVRPGDAWPCLGIRYDQRIGRGIDILWQGGSTRGAQPSFTAQMHASGGSLLGCSVDHIAKMEPAAAEAFVRGGMLSVQPHPMTRDDIYAFLYLCYRGSLRFLHEGQPLLDRLAAHFAAPLQDRLTPNRRS